MLASLPLSLSAAPALSAAQIRTWQADHTRVSAIALRLLSANLDRCPDARHFDFGYLALNLAPDAAGAVRDLWSTAIGLTPQPQLVVITPNGPAAAAGLQVGDRIAAMDGVAWEADPAPRAAYFTAARAAQAAGHMTLQVDRAGGSVTVTLAGATTCAVSVALTTAPGYNASTYGTRVEVQAGVPTLLTDQDELAAVVAHEIAHALLRHSGPGQEAAVRDPARRARIEREADALGVRLLLRAGFDPMGAARATPRLDRANRGPLSRMMGLYGSYMPTEQRVAFLTEQAAQARAEQANPAP
ncbi:M48 family metalloprotease [Novosphingobium sp. FSY-8]|uniref:M48 family metalloprotease n=2 Tax=Novosphingobium ovatum TaxID=1908523 RepID=A0ABW9XET6_9SPHN|nr:M48 family metalloprotease [Novosphingobium ovatum]